MKTYIFTKTPSGFDMTYDGSALSFTDNVAIAGSVGGNVVGLNIEGVIYHINVAADTITVNGEAFSGTATELSDKLAGEVFISTGGGTGPDGEHTHVIGDITGLQSALNGKAASTHSHAISDVTGLQTALDGKAAATHSHTASEISDFQTAVSANTDVAANTAAKHTHSNKEVLDGITGAGSGTAFLANDGTYKTPAGGGDVVSAGKAGGQTLTGGTASGEHLKLKSTSNSVKGRVYLDDAETIYTEGGKLYINGVDVTTGGGASTANLMDSRVYTDNFLSAGSGNGLHGDLKWWHGGSTGNGSGGIETAGVPGMSPRQLWNSPSVASGMAYFAPVNTGRSQYYLFNFDYQILRFRQSSLTAADAGIRFGVFSNVTQDVTATSGIGCWIEKLPADTNWFAYCKSAHAQTPTRADLGVAHAVNTIFAFKMERDYATGNIRVYNTADGGDTWTLLATISTNLPASTTAWAPGFQLLTPNASQFQFHTAFYQLSLKRLAKTS